MRHVISRMLSSALLYSLCIAAIPCVHAAIPTSERQVLVDFYADAGGDGWSHHDNWNGPPGTECSWYGITCDDDQSHVVRIVLSNGYGNEQPPFQLYGTLPPSLRDLTRLQYFDVSNNALTGPIPPLSGLTDLEVFEVSVNQLEGPVPELTGLTSLQYFDFDWNQLSGSIPSLDGLTNLISFGATANQLTGSLPSLVDLTSLESLRVGQNRLSGIVPPFPGPDPQAYFSTLCPNPFTRTDDAGWDAATGYSPWYLQCEGYTNVNQDGLNGSWYNPYINGQGVILDVLPDLIGPGAGLMFGGWFTYGPSVTSMPNGLRWYSMQGEVDSNAPMAMLDLYEADGGSFAAPPIVAALPIGSVTLLFTGCSTTLTYHFDDGRVPDSVIYLGRLTGDVSNCDTGSGGNPNSNALLSGAWYDPSLSGQGFLIDISASQNTLFAGWYTFARYAPHGDPSLGKRWYSLQANIAPGATSMTNVPIYLTTGGIFNNSSTPVTSAIGRADLTFASCNELTLTYDFESGENQGLSSTMHLVRLGPAPDGCHL